MKEGMSGREKKNRGRDDGLPDKGRGTDCYEILSNVRISAQGASCSRSASRQNEMLADKSVRRPCERLPVHTYSKPRSPLPPTRPFPSNFPLYARKCCRIYRMSRNYHRIFRGHCPKKAKLIVSRTFV